MKRMYFAFKRFMKNTLLVVWRLVLTLVYNVAILFVPCFSNRLNFWHTVWFVITTLYLYNHWTQAMIFIPFNGYALIFVVWVFMIMKPFIKTVGCQLGTLELNKADNSKHEFEEKLKQAKRNLALKKGEGR